MHTDCQMPGNTLKQASVVLMRVVWWVWRVGCKSLNCISIISPFTSQFSESLSDAPCQGSWFLGEEHCTRRELWPMMTAWRSISSHSSCSFCLLLLPGSSNRSLFQVLRLVGSWPGYTAQEGTGVNCFCCYRWADWEDMKTLLRRGS